MSKMSTESFKTTKQRISVSLLIITGIATFGSLYLSIGLGLIPCRYCWYQRVLMYPLLLISILGIVKNTLYEDIYLLFSLLGMTISGYHSVLQRIGSDTACSVSCAEIIYTVTIFSIPNLAFISFTMLLVVILYAKYYDIP